MKNYELYSPGCPNNHAKGLVMGYVMLGLVENHGLYSSDRLLARQHAVYLEWLTEVHKSTTNFECGFYEWLIRKCDAAFVFKPGDLVKHDGRYCVVVRRCPHGVGWANSWRLRGGLPTQAIWPMPLDTVELKDPTGHTYVVNALAGNIEPADIPPEVFALACGKAKGCPMMKGGTE